MIIFMEIWLLFHINFAFSKLWFENLSEEMTWIEVYLLYNIVINEDKD